MDMHIHKHTYVRIHLCTCMFPYIHRYIFTGVYIYIFFLKANGRTLNLAAFLVFGHYEKLEPFIPWWLENSEAMWDIYR